MKYFLIILSLTSAIHWTYEINSDVNLRKGPDNKKRVLTSVAKGKEITVLEKTNEWWWQVEYQGTKGYIAASFISRSYPKTFFRLAKQNPVATGALTVLLGALIFMALPGKKSETKKKVPKAKKRK
jgi:uncharacterized protein YraI